MEKNKTVEEYLAKQELWKDSLQLLRELITAEPFTETVKWGIPVYTINGKNVVGIGAFKSYVGLWFYQGVFLKDPHDKLLNAQEGKTQAMRQWRFESLEEIQKDAPIVNAYLKEAIANQKKGKEVKPSKKPLIIPPALQAELDKDSNLKASFEGLSLTNKRDFAEHISTAKQEATVQRRLQKILPMIAQGIGLNDKYKKWGKLGD